MPDQSRKKKSSLTEADWRSIFLLRCRSKRGERLTRTESSLCHRAWKEDPERYSADEIAIFEATKPFGAT
jgi:hypothetical protein